MEKVGAIVLAAGGSSRLGEPKQLLKHRGIALVRSAPGAALEAGFAPVVVVTGAAHAQVVQELCRLPVQIHQHPDWRRGIGSSIRAGIEQITRAQPSLAAVLILVCDQPFVRAELLAELVAARGRSGKTIAASEYGGTVGVPALFDRVHFSRLLALPDAHGAKELLLAQSDEMVRVAFPRGAIDIDTPADRHAHLDDP